LLFSVLSVDHIPELVELAKKNTAKDHGEFLETGRVAYHAADGRVGFSDEAPYDCM
jgi:protein-L-isoaspartate(D-aspartate) O-methyltransferase